MARKLANPTPGFEIEPLRGSNDLNPDKFKLIDYNGVSANEIAKSIGRLFMPLRGAEATYGWVFVLAPFHGLHNNGRTNCGGPGMNQRLQELGLELLGLSAQSRAYLAARLLDSLDESEDENHEQLWMDEVNRRLADVREGKAELTSVEDVLKEIKARLGH